MPSSVVKLTLVVTFMLAGLGCQSDGGGSKDKPKPTTLQPAELTQLDRWAVESPIRASVEAGVVTQSALFEYHFNQGKSSLTPVGRRDLTILARYYRGEDWTLVVRQGNASDALYATRLDAVEAFVVTGFPSRGSLTILDGLPGGAGLASTDARRIRKDSLKSTDSLSTGAIGSDQPRPLDSTLEGGS